MNDLFTLQMIAQIFGILASIFIITGFFQKLDQRLRILMVFGNLSFVVHFYLLGANTGAALNLVNAFRNAIALRRRNHILIPFGLVGLCVLVGVLTYSDPTDILPVIGASISTLAMFF